MDFRHLLLILLLHISGSLTLDNLSVKCDDICAVMETTTQLKCRYNNIQIKTVFWFNWKQSKYWRNNNEPEDLILDSDYSGRVKHQIKNDQSTLTISDLRERDSGEYQLMFIMEDGVQHLSSVSVSLAVTDLKVRVTPVSSDSTDEKVLTCDASCDLTSKPQKYYWKRNGQYLQNTRTIRVPSNADSSYGCFLTPDFKISSSPVCISKDQCWDVSYSSRRVCALVGSTVDFSGSYSHPSAYTVMKTFWHYVKPGNFMDLREELQFAGRMEIEENKLRIKDLKTTDSGEYRFRIITNRTGGEYSGSPGVILTVTDTQVTQSPDIISDGEKVILSCSTKCALSDKHTFIWWKNGRQLTDGFTKLNKLYLDSVSSEELQQYSCAVGDTPPNPVANTALQTTLIILSVFLVLALIGILWFRWRKNNSSQKRENMKENIELDSSTVYDTIAPLPTVCTKQVDKNDQDVHYSSISFKQSPAKDTSLAPSSVPENVHYATVKFS